MTLDKRTVALGVVAAVAVAAAVTVTAVNHRSTGSKERKSVSAYIGAVNSVQNQMHAPLTRVMLAYRDFTGKQGPSRRAAAELATAVATLERLRSRLAATPAPPEARKLRRLLLDLIGRQAAITREVQLMAVFSPKFSAVLQQARAANATLGKALKAIQVPKPHKLRGTKKKVLAAQHAYQLEAQAAANAQADAVDAYDAKMLVVIAKLRRLVPPPAFAAGRKTQIDALTHVAAAGARLSVELRKTKRRDIAVLGRRFTLASREAQSVAAQKAQIAAIRGYNARARAIGIAAGRVQNELLRLQRTLP